MSLLIPVTEEKNALGLNKEPISKLYGAKFISLAKASGSKCVIIMSGKKIEEERIVSETYAQVNTSLSYATEDYPMKVSVLSVSGNTRDNYPYDLSIRTSQIVEVYADSNASNSVIRVRSNENKEDMYYTVSGDLDDIKSKVPRKYKALLSQNTPIATTKTPAIVAGQIWEDTIGTANAGDLVILGGYELISGTLGGVNAKYRSVVDESPVFTTASLAYDGSPYVVSTDVNGDFNPSVNTTGDNFTIIYNATGKFIFNHPTIVFDKSKSFLSLDLKKIAQSYYTNNFDGSNEFKIYTYNSSGVATNNILNYTPIEIEVHP